jgi:three-Cys-motif partner protein
MADKNENIKQQSSWGGMWTEQKLDTFESYVRAYLTIMNSFRDKFHWKLLYFDGFAGSGTRKNDDPDREVKKLKTLFGDQLIDNTDLSVYQGAAERIVSLESTMRGFDFYYFIDKEEDNCTALELKLSQYNTVGRKVFRPGDANMQALNLANALRRDKNMKALALLDPFGMQINWEVIESLSGPNIDLWILIPSGVIVNRLLKTNGELMYPDRLVQFFGLPEQELMDRFYVRKKELTLFGEEETIEKKSHCIERIAELYVERLGELFPFVTPEPLVMRNNHNVPIFHFVCASFNQTAVKIAQQIIDKRQ